MEGLHDHRQRFIRFRSKKPKPTANRHSPNIARIDNIIPDIKKELSYVRVFAICYVKNDVVTSYWKTRTREIEELILRLYQEAKDLTVYDMLNIFERRGWIRCDEITIDII